MRDFVFTANPARVVFGAGKRAALASELDHLGITRALVLCTPEQRAQAEAAAASVGARAVGVFDRAVMHVPVETVAEASAVVAETGADGTVAVGGGSTTGLGKALARAHGLPIVAVPTTFAGSEMTPIWGLTQDGIKTTGRDSAVLPKTVIYDPELLMSLPTAVAGPSGMNAIAHAVEALYVEATNPIAQLMAEESIRALAASLPRVIAMPDDIDARAEALYGAWLASVVLGTVGVALHHKLCHTLGGSFNLPHADTHTIVLPHAVAYNAPAAPDAMARVAAALGVDGDAAAGLFDLATALGARTALRDLGMAAGDLDLAAQLATENPYDNPRPVERDGIRALLQDAFDGRRPGT